MAFTDAADPSPRLAPYRVSKTGGALTRALALEWAARGVRVAAVGLGPIQSPVTLSMLVFYVTGGWLL